MTRVTPTTDGTAEALFGRTRRSVLGLLYGRPDQSFYLREIVRLTGTGSGAVQRELSQLAGAGLVLREPRGPQVYFRANQQHPVYPELSGIIVKTAGIADVLRAVLAEVVEAGKVDVAFIYGSVASGRQGTASDVDVMIVGAIRLQDLAGPLRLAQNRLGREVNPTIYRPDEFRAKASGGAHFLRRVIAGPKIMLVGTTDEFERLAR
jgi:uncharacterized protein